MRILVTGGFGFMGSRLVEALLMKGYSVRVLDVGQDSPFVENFYQGFLEILRGDIRESKTCVEACNGIDVVFHMAAVASIHQAYQNPDEAFEVNVKGTENLISASRGCGVKLFIFASSGKIYGNTLELPSKESDAPKPTTPYGFTKYECEKMCARYAQDSLLKIISLRYFSVYGPGMHLAQGLIGGILVDALRDGKITFEGNKEMERDFTYIDDAIRATILCLDYPSRGHEIFNVASGRSCCAADLIYLLQKRFSGKLDVQYKNPPEGTIFKTRADISRAIKLLAYTPRMSLEEGLIKTFEWFDARGVEKDASLGKA